jgi:hypothetical protein
MDWGSAAIALTGLAVAALSLILTYRERVAALRSALYSKQIEAYGELLHALSDLHQATLTFTTAQGFTLNPQARTALRTEVQPQMTQLARVFVRNAVFLPKAVGDAVVEYRETLNAISAPSEVAMQYPPELVHADDPQMVLTKAFTRVWDAMRRQLGTGPLSQQTLKLLGRPESELEPS